MSKARRVWTIIGAVTAIQGAVFLMFMPIIAFEAIAMGVGMMLTFYGIKYLLYYLTHAQHMVGGKWFLLIGLILFDMGIFATALYNQAQAIAIIYVVGAHLVGAVLNYIRAFGNKKDNNPGWKIDLAQGIGNTVQIVLCLVFINSVIIPVYCYCVYAIYTGILMIISACKKTAIVYIQ